MRRVLNYFVFFILLSVSHSFAAAIDDQSQVEDPGVFTGEYRQGIPLGDFSGQSQAAQPQSNYPGVNQTVQPQSIQNIPSMFKTTAPVVTTPASPSSIEQMKKKPSDQKAADSKPKLRLKAEAGDGLISLSWSVLGLHQKPGDSPARYTVFYGTESGRYNKKIDVGPVTDFRLRELKNNQPYFIKVNGTAKFAADADSAESRPSEISFFSNEFRVTPLPEEEQGSLLERSFAGKVLTLHDKLESDKLKRDLKQFGYDFFKNGIATSASSDMVPVGSDYIIGPGDSLRIELWGSIQAIFEVSVDRNGEIFIPRIGNIKIWGTSYSQAKEVINKAISRYYKGYELNVTLGRLRNIQVFVVGEVEMPGTYALPSVGTVINALSLAGGPSKNGSLRKITISRNGKPVQEIDLYDMFLTGDRSKDIRLENGDTIFVPVLGPVSAIAGEVKRPGIYELKGKSSLFQLLSMAGGISASGDNGRIQLERIEGNSSRVMVDYEPKSGKLEEMLSGVDLLDRDMVKVFPVHKAFRKVVSLQGNVVRPGEYQFRSGMRIKDIIPSFEVLLPDSYLQTAEIVRLVKPDFHKETLSFNLQKAIEGEEQNNILLEEQDTIKVLSRSEMEEKATVSINGQVINPGNYDYYPKMTVRDLLIDAGGLKRNAHMESAEITSVMIADGTARVVRKNFNLKKALAGDTTENLTLKPEDTVVIRGIVEWPELSDRFVELKGEVRYPGVYSIIKGEKLSSVILRAGGFTEKAYLKGAKFVRKSVKESQQKRMDEIIERAEHDILKKQGELASLAASKEELEATKSALEGLMKSLEKLRSARAEGRVVIRLAEVDELRKGPFDLEMLGGDVLEIPPTPSVVNIMGQVYNPTSFVYIPQKNVSHYLKSAGGPTRDAEENDMYVIKADGSVNSRQNSTMGISWDENSRSWAFGSFHSRSLDPGDTLVVPQKLERIAWLREIKDITTIVSQIALTAGTILIGLK